MAKKKISATGTKKTASRNKAVKNTSFARKTGLVNKTKPPAIKSTSNGDLALSILCEMINFRLINDTHSKKISKSEITPALKKKITLWLAKHSLGTWKDIKEEAVVGSYSDNENKIFIFTVRSPHKEDHCSTFAFFTDPYGGITCLGYNIDCRD